MVLLQFITVWKGKEGIFSVQVYSGRKARSQAVMERVSWICTGRVHIAWTHGDALFLTECLHDTCSRRLKNLPRKPHPAVRWVPSKILHLLAQHHLDTSSSDRNTQCHVCGNRDTPVSPVPPLSPKHWDVWSKGKNKKQWLLSRNSAIKHRLNVKPFTQTILQTRLWSSCELCSRTAVMLG